MINWKQILYPSLKNKKTWIGILILFLPLWPVIFAFLSTKIIRKFPRNNLTIGFTSLVWFIALILNSIWINVLASPSNTESATKNSVTNVAIVPKMISSEQTIETTKIPENTKSEENNKLLVSLVIDGDTIEIEGGQKVRLIGIDSPESVDPNRPVGCYAIEASEFTKSKLQDKYVTLEKDVSETDKFGRLLRYVWLDDELVNETLVKEGYATSITYPPDIKYQDKFMTVQEEAKNDQKGLWSEVCISPTPKILIPTVTPRPTQIITATKQPTPIYFVPQTGGTGNCKYSCSGPDRDCSDFASHAEAQAFFNCCGFSAGNDPMRLDKATGTGNGLACESLP